MHVNVSYRLIKNMIEKGFNFVDHNGKTVSLPKSLYSTKDYKQGDIVRKLRGELCLYPKKGSIHIGNDMYIIDEYGQFMNNSFTPNVKIELNSVIAIKDISKYEEITFNCINPKFYYFEINGT